MLKKIGLLLVVIYLNLFCHNTAIAAEITQAYWWNNSEGNTNFNETDDVTLAIKTTGMNTGDTVIFDIHEDDFRGMAEPQAPVGFYKTPPLWGLRKSAPYLHDGRASTIEQAIEMHFDEANLSRQNYLNLTAQEREDLLLFLNDL